MPWMIPAAVAGGAGLLLLLGHKKTVGPVTPVVPPEPPGPGPFIRPHEFPNPPAGSGSAIVTPACGPNDPPGCSNGLIIHSAPSTNSPAAPQDTSPHSPHLLAGEVATIIADNIPDQSLPPTTRLWAQVINPLGDTGFVSSVDPQGRSNFTNKVPPAATPPAPAAAGIATGATPQRPQRFGYGWHHPQQNPQQRFSPPAVRMQRAGYLAQCHAPTGCWLRSAPNTNAPGQTVVPRGATVHVLSAVPGLRAFASSPGQGGWSLVRAQNQQGWVPSEWLT